MAAASRLSSSSPVEVFGTEPSSEASKVVWGSINSILATVQPLEKPTESPLLNMISQQQQLSTRHIEALQRGMKVPAGLKIVPLRPFADENDESCWRVLNSTSCSKGCLGIMPVILESCQGKIFSRDHIIAIIVDHRSDKPQIIIFDPKGCSANDHYWKRNVFMYEKEGGKGNLQQLRDELSKNFPDAEVFLSQQTFQLDWFNCGVYYCACMKLMIECVEKNSTEAVPELLLKYFQDFISADYRKNLLEILREAENEKSLNDDWVEL